MRPVVVPAILLLVVLMSMGSEAGDPAAMCKTKYPATPCRNKNVGEGWFQMGNDRCVKAFYDTPHFGYLDAENACKKFPNGHLVSIHDDVELNQVICAMYRASTVKAYYRIGGYRKQIGGTQKWAWTDESKFAYTKWAGGQPDFYRYREYCIEMNYWDWGLWNDVNCADKKPYVCAVKV